MDPVDPHQARQIVIEYARTLERDITENRHPARVDSLPYAKSIIKTAISTSVQELARSGQLTEDLRQYFETAYTSLAEYLDAELVHLMAQYRQSADQLTTGSQIAGEKTKTAAWRTLAESGALAGEVARTTTLEAEKLKAEFQSLLTSA